MIKDMQLLNENDYFVHMFFIHKINFYFLNEKISIY